MIAGIRREGGSGRGAVENRAEMGSGALGGLCVENGVSAIEHLIRRQVQSGHGGQDPLRVGLGPGDLVAAGNGAEQTDHVQVLQHSAQRGAFFAADHAGGDAPFPQGFQQRPCAGEKLRGGDLERVGLFHVIPAEQGPLAGVAVSGEKGVAVFQNIAHRCPDRLPVRFGQSHPGKGILEAGHDRLGGVPERIIKIKKYRLKFHELHPIV